MFEKRVEAPFIPNPNADNFDKRHIMKEEDNPEDSNPMALRRNSIQAMFDGYEIDNSVAIKNFKEKGGMSFNGYSDDKLHQWQSTNSSTNPNIHNIGGV